MKFIILSLCISFLPNVFAQFFSPPTITVRPATPIKRKTESEKRQEAAMVAQKKLNQSIMDYTEENINTAYTQLTVDINDLSAKINEAVFLKLQTDQEFINAVAKAYKILGEKK